jgi:sulfur carrier protein
MKLFVNGASVEYGEPLTITTLLAQYKLKPETVVVEYNRRVPGKHEYDQITLAEGDQIEIVKFMGGG